MLLNIDETYKKIKNGTLTKEEKKENKKYFLSIFKCNFKEIHNYLKFLYKRKNDNEFLESFRSFIYCVYGINTMEKELFLIKKINGK